MVEFYGDQAEAHPVGTGPFKLAQWRRSSFLAFDRNPDFREMFYDAEPAADDAEGQALLARFKGRRLPMIDRVEISIIEEEQPRWLAFVNGEADVAYRVGYQFAPQAMPNGKVAPNLAKRGIRGFPWSRRRASTTSSTWKIRSSAATAPRRWRCAARSASASIRARSSPTPTTAWARSSQGPTLPNTTAYDPTLKTEVGDYDPARARALLDLYGYVDKDGDGWRERPDGSPLVLRVELGIAGALSQDLRSPGRRT